MKRLTPWAWISAGGDLALDIPKLLAAMNVKDTPANRDECTRLATQILRDQYPQTQAIIVTKKERP
jgi:hypothetical protein